MQPSQPGNINTLTIYTTYGIINVHRYIDTHMKHIIPYKTKQSNMQHSLHLPLYEPNKSNKINLIFAALTKINKHALN